MQTTQKAVLKVINVSPNKKILRKSTLKLKSSLNIDLHCYKNYSLSLFKFNVSLYCRRDP